MVEALHPDAATQIRHPLDPLSSEEIAAAIAVVRCYPEIGKDVRFISVNLVEPSKAELQIFAAGSVSDRRILIVLLDLEAGCAFEATVDLGGGQVVSYVARHGVQPGIALEEFALCEQAVKADAKWQAALRRRGLSEFEHAIVDAWSVGAYGDERYPSRRMARALSYIRGGMDDVGYGRPIEGVIAYVDLSTMEVLEVEEGVEVPLPPLTGHYTPATVGPLRNDVKPLEIVQPQGASFTVDGHEVRWQHWRFRVGYTFREGLVLHQIAYEDQGVVRPILHRASMSEMLVPYGDPTPTHNKKNVFDNGEYGIGRMANSLELGCDCLGSIHYFDAPLVDMTGTPVLIKNAICLHEEDHGTLWKHTDRRLGHAEVRRSRRLVISSFATVGNYDYGFFWYFYQTGDIEIEVKLTGVLSVGAIEAGRMPTHGAPLTSQLYAPIHQHHFVFRLDMDVDGARNSLVEVNTVMDPIGPDNPYGGSFRAEYTKLKSEGVACRDADLAGGRAWLVENPNKSNALGRPPAYKIVPGADVARPFAYPQSSMMKRGGFIAHTLWATAYDPGELYASGDYINQNPEPMGLHRWIERDKSLENTDLVVWYVVGTHHVPRPEDWPVMPVVRAGFALRPVGFFDRNPALDLPPPGSSQSCCV
jgi:primary-amine oxidase